VQLFQFQIGSEEATIELIYLVISKRPTVVHRFKETPQPLPDLTAARVEVLIVSLPDQVIAQKLGRKTKGAPHVLTEKDKDRPIENFLSQAYKTALRAGETICFRPIVEEEHTVKVFAERTVLLIKAVLQLALSETLPLDQ
jgi:hypothetical protein